MVALEPAGGALFLSSPLGHGPHQPQDGNGTPQHDRAKDQVRNASITTRSVAAAAHARTITAVSTRSHVAARSDPNDERHKARQTWAVARNIPSTDWVRHGGCRRGAGFLSCLQATHIPCGLTGGKTTTKIGWPALVAAVLASAYSIAEAITAPITGHPIVDPEEGAGFGTHQRGIVLTLTLALSVAVLMETVSPDRRRQQVSPLGGRLGVRDSWLPWSSPITFCGVRWTWWTAPVTRAGDQMDLGRLGWQPLCKHKVRYRRRSLETCGPETARLTTTWCSPSTTGASDWR